MVPFRFCSAALAGALALQIMTPIPADKWPVAGRLSRRCRGMADRERDGRATGGPLVIELLQHPGRALPLSHPILGGVG